MTTQHIDFREAAGEYREYGFALVPTRGKRAFVEEWEKAGTPEEKDTQFWGNGHANNIGVVLGAPSGGLVNLDRESCTDDLKRIEHMFLPKMVMAGRGNRPYSHAFCYSPGLPSRALH